MDDDKRKIMRKIGKRDELLLEDLEILVKVVEFDLQIYYEQIEEENVLEKEEFEQNIEIGEVLVICWERTDMSVELWGKW